ncbi:MAG TPA: acetyl-CoA carboxylase biotin carboxyl carrier protein [Candidatus Binataceae bacterium]|nr:acetyl-CoA carboxylase biotin carboxyl carrier protein [Candidatus Binataceae bacterium]
MEPREIKALLELMKEYGLLELAIEDKKGKIRLVRGDLVPAAHHESAPPPAPPGKSRTPLPKREAPPPAASEDHASGRSNSAPPALADNQKLVTSPMVGTFYRAASPDAEPFTEEGDHVRKGQALCIIEAMKMMNEIEAEVSGRVVRILCENAQPVEYGQPLLILETA